MQEFKIRASGAGQVMTNPRTKSELVSKTTLTFVENWLKQQLYGYQQEIRSKYIDKGNQLEDLAIDTAIELLNLDFILKNTDTFEDNFFTGTPDLVTEDEVLDIKCSWDAYTFPLFDDEIPTKDYLYQLQVYMHLTGKEKARLVYVLLDTPETMIYEVKREYGHLDKTLRIKTFDVTYDPEVISELQNRVKTIREILKTDKYAKIISNIGRSKIAELNQ
jgi:hypothetical protein